MEDIRDKIVVARMDTCVGVGLCLSPFVCPGVGVMVNFAGSESAAQPYRMASIWARRRGQKALH